jgi:hypothetical protein
MPERPSETQKAHFGLSSKVTSFALHTHTWLAIGTAESMVHIYRCHKSAWKKENSIFIDTTCDLGLNRSEAEIKMSASVGGMITSLAWYEAFTSIDNSSKRQEKKEETTIANVMNVSNEDLLPPPRPPSYHSHQQEDVGGHRVKRMKLACAALGCSHILVLHVLVEVVEDGGHHLDIVDREILKGHSSGVTALAWSSQGLLASSSLDGTVHVWHHPERFCTFQEHIGRVLTLAWIDATTLVSGGEDQSIRSWQWTDYQHYQTSNTNTVRTY